MLLRLNVEQRARQLGLLAALGYSPGALRWMILREGLLVAILGAIAGLLAAVGYTWLMMAGLRTWWIGAVGTTSLFLHVQPATLAAGFGISLILAVIAIIWSVRRVGKIQAARLLAGGWAQAESSPKMRGRLSRAINLGITLIAIALILCGAFKMISAQLAFLSGGTLLLIGSMIYFTGALKPSRASLRVSIDGMGLGNASRHPGRSTLTMTLIACSAFILVTIAAFRGAPEEDTTSKSSGAGGYSLMLQADIPLTGDLNTPAGRDVLAVTNPDDPLWFRLKFTPMRRWTGEDISCLNLTRPGSPTILGVPQSMIDRAGFTFASATRQVENRWTLLQEPLPDAIPVIADDETAQYILHLDLGKSMEITDQTGARCKLTLVATLSGSVFQGQLLMADSNFVKHFPSQSGAGVVMVEAARSDTDNAAKMLRSQLGDFSVTVDRTADVLAMYKDVQNTYMATFQVLGSLGLLLGTIGLAVVLLRGLFERRAELAMLAALGFRRADRLRMILVENGLLLLAGLASGTLCAAIAMLPTILHGRRVHLAQLVLTLAGILLTGLIALVLAAWLGGRRMSAADLRHE